jgi:hypothetical protein
MKKTVIIIFLCNVFVYQLKGEGALLKSQYIECSYFFTRDDNRDDVYYFEDRDWFHEHNIFGRVGVSITKSLYAGFQLNGIITKSNTWNTTDKEFFLLYGIYAQYFFINRQKIKLFGETSLSYGDYNVSYNSIEQIDNVREKGLYYLGLTGGAKLRLFVDKLYLSASYTWQPTISKIKEFNNPYHISNYTHNTFNLGICYYLDLSLNLKLKRNPVKHKIKKGMIDC